MAIGYGDWIKSNYQFDERIANVSISYYIWEQLNIERFLKEKDDPILLEKILNKFFSVFDYGKYHNATVFRVMHSQYSCLWCITIAHPSLPSRKLGEEVPEIMIEFHDGEIYQFNLEMEELMRERINE